MVNSPSDLGLQIHRHPHDTNRYLIILSNDANSYGDAITACFEDIASAVREIYSLGDANVTWVEHNTADSAFTHDEEDTFERVTFERDNHETRWLSGPNWHRISSFEGFLSAWRSH